MNDFLATCTEYMEELLSNGYFVGGVTAGVVLLSVIIGLLLAEKSIKRGFYSYDD